MSEEKIYGELIWQLAKEKKYKLIDILIEKLKKEGKSSLLKSVLTYLEEKHDHEEKFIKGVLKLAFPQENDHLINFLEKRVGKKIKIDKITIDENLILGGVFIGKNVKVDFSFKNLISKVFSAIK